MNLSRGGGFLVVILTISVGINLFLAGNQVGLWFHRPPPINFEQRFDMLLRGLPDGDRATAHDILEQHRQELQSKFHLYRSAAQAAGAAIHAEPFDVDGTRAAFAKANDLSADFRRSLQDTLIEIAGKISPTGREHLRPGIAGP